MNAAVHAPEALLQEPGSAPTPMPVSTAPRPFASGVAPHAEAAPSWCLRFLTGPMKGRTVALRRGANLLGSAPDCDLMLPGGEVLPRHLLFTVGELVVSVQRIGAAAARLNGDEIRPQRRSLVAGDVIAVGQTELQVDRLYAGTNGDDEAGSEWADSILPGDGSVIDEPPPAARGSGIGWRAGVAAGLLGLCALLVLAMQRGGSAADAGAPTLQAVQRQLGAYPEVDVVVEPSGQFSLKGQVESRERKAGLVRAMAPFGKRVAVNVQAVDDMVEQARRFIGDPGVSVAYGGRGRLVVSGTVEDEAVRQKIRRLADDLQPAVVVSDKLAVRPRPQAERDAEADQRARWANWQGVLPARMVGITDDGRGLRYIQLANGSRYYEGSLLRSGAELTRIEDDHLVITGGPPPPGRAPP